MATPKTVNISVIDTKPKDISVVDTKSKDISVFGETVIYMETRTIKQGQPIPWGLNWLITYPTVLTFQGIRF